MTLLILVITLSFVSSPKPLVIPASRAQTNATIKGQVFDSRFGVPLPGTTVTILSEGVQQKTTSGQDGGYWFRGLAEGQYTLSAQNLGFARTERRVQLRSGEQMVLDIPLRVGRLHDPIQIEIRGAARLVDNTPSGDVNIIVISPFDQEIVAKTKTDNAGHYYAKVDDPGQYVLYAFKSGFEVIAIPFILRPSLPRQPYVKDIVLSPLNLK